MPKKYRTDYFEDVKVMRRRRGFFRKFFLFILLAIITFGVVVSADYVGGFIATGNFSFSIFKGKNETVEYYAIILFESENKEEAEQKAQESSDNGGAGYVWEDGKYMVVANVYKRQSDAEKVIENLSETEYSPVIRTVRYVKSENYKEVLKVLEGIYSDLYEISKGLDKGEVSVVFASSEINKIASDIHVLQLKYSTMQTAESGVIADILMKVYEGLQSSSIQLLCDDNSSYIVKNVIVKTVFNAVELANTKL